jgi:hypothetical protein
MYALSLFGGRYLLPFPGRGLCPAVEIEREPDPIVEIALGPKSVSVDSDVAPVLPTFHDHSGTAFPSESHVMVRRVDAAHDATLPYGDAHLALDHESDAAEHFLFCDAPALSNSRPYAIYQSFVRWHCVVAEG